MGLVKHYIKFTLYIMIIGIILLLGLEKTVRYNDVQSHLLIPSLGSDYVLLERQLYGLEQMQKKYGRLDCIIIGSSISAGDIHSTYLDQAYYQTTGEHFYCYNFSLLGAQANTIEPIAHYLIAKFHPRYFIYGISPIAFSSHENQSNHLIYDGAWFRYIDGDANIEGWLIEHSYLERYYLRYKIWLNHPTSAQYEEITNWGMIHDETGHIPGFRSEVDVKLPPNPELFSVDQHMLNNVIGNYKLGENNIGGLTKLIEETADYDTQFIIMDMPLHPSFQGYYRESGLQHSDYIVAINQIAQAGDVPFWTLSTANLIPDELWRDRHHLSSVGTVYFSIWLGTQLGNIAVENGDITTLSLNADDIDLEALLPNFGLSDEYWLEYQTSLQNTNLPQGIIWHPDVCPSIDTILMYQTNIGLVLTLRDYTPAWRNRDYALINLLNNIVCTDNLELTPTQVEQITQWNIMGEPQLLEALPINYLVYSSTWLYIQSETVQQQLNNPEKYELIKQYSTPISAPIYYVVRPLQNE